MPVKVRATKGGKYLVDVRLRLSDGTRVRERLVSPLTGKSASERWGQDRIAHLLKHGKDAPKVVPTFAEFEKEFVEKYVAPNNKPSEAESKRNILATHLVPAFGSMRLDEIGPKQIEEYKAAKVKAGAAKKTINNQLGVLGKILRTAAAWGEIPKAPAILRMKLGDTGFDFLTFEEATRLVDGADGFWKTMMLVGLRTGLRLGELRALRWIDVDLSSGLLRVRQAAWRGIIGTPKGGKSREIPLSAEALAALRAMRHLRGEFVFCHEGGEMLTHNEPTRPLWRACKRAGLRPIGWHVLRHSFASHLVMRGVTMKATQELMGHTTMAQTMRYAHLAPVVRDEAVLLLDGGSGRASQSTTAAEAKKRQRVR